MSVTGSQLRRVKNWTSVVGARGAEIVQHGQTMATGTIDAVTNDGAILWVQDGSGRRRLYERCESIEVWGACDDVGPNYRVSKADS
ncbi:hypothetical protein SAMN04487914_1119 [Arthrobacter sp. ok909]|nr:hypothetical protein SAMN04487914_1119 [Arthrobacter sp. ok909]